MFAIKFNRIENSQINILTERLTNHDPVNGLHYLCECRSLSLQSI